MRQMTSNLSMGSGIMMAVMAGAAVGAGVALLFAPCSGADARNWIGRRAREVAGRAQDAMSDVASSIESPMRRSPGAPAIL